MPTGFVCQCGALTKHPSGKCERCRHEHAARRRLRRAVYDSPAWHRCRRFVWARDDWTCVRCGRRDPGNRNGTLDAHHTRPVLELAARGLATDPRYAETLCDKCHGKA